MLTERRSGTRAVELRSAPLEPEQRYDRVRPGLGWWRDARVERIGAVQARVELRPELLEPGGGEGPAPGLLQAVEGAGGEAPDGFDPDRRVNRRGDLAALEQLQPLGVESARRRRIEHDSPADGRAPAQDDAIPARGHDRLGEAELRVAFAGARKPRVDLGRAMVHFQTRAVPDRLELLERDVQSVADREVPRSDERVAAPEPVALDSGQADRHAPPGLGPLDRLVVHLDASNADVDPRRLGPQIIALGDRARPERAGRDGADPLQREDAVDEEPGRAGDMGRLRQAGDLDQGRAQLVE